MRHRVIRLLLLSAAGILITVIAFQWRRSVMGLDPRRTLKDSLLILERKQERSPLVDVITGPLDGIAGRPMATVSRSDLPPWVQALQLPWIRPAASPSGQIAVERVTSTGSDVYVMSDATSEPIPIAVGGGINAVLGWSPDGQSLLVRRSKVLPDQSVDADLWSYHLDGRALVATPIDTTSQRAIEEAAWSPDGARIAWVARIGPAHQRDIFVGYADGSAAANVTENPGEDYHISWSPDGSLLGFTSDRDGNPDLFALEFSVERRLWRLTSSPGDEDYATFSPDNRTVAFQSTANGDAAVYVMPALGGAATRVTPPGRQFSILGWRGKPGESYADRLRIIGQSTSRPGDSVAFSLIGTDRDGNAVLPENAALALVPDGSAAAGGAVLRRDTSAAHRYVLHVSRPGVVRLAASIPGWRYDSLSIEVDRGDPASGDDDFASGIADGRWIALGSPRPTTERMGGETRLLPNADLEWQSGILSRQALTVTDPFEVSTTLHAPFAGRSVAGASMTLAIVEERAVMPSDASAPRFTELIAITWDGETSRFNYSVGSDTRSEPVTSLGADSVADVRLAIDRAGRVTFFVGGKQRWSSLVRFLGAGSIPRGRIWLAGRATGRSDTFGNFRLRRSAP